MTTAHGLAGLSGARNLSSSRGARLGMTANSCPTSASVRGRRLAAAPSMLSRRLTGTSLQRGLHGVNCRAPRATAGRHASVTAAQREIGDVRPPGGIPRIFEQRFFGQFTATVVRLSRFLELPHAAIGVPEIHQQRVRFRADRSRPLEQSRGFRILAPILIQRTESNRRAEPACQLCSSLHEVNLDR